MRLDQLRHLRGVLVKGKLFLARRVFGSDIDPTVEMSLSAHLDRNFPSGVHIGARTYLAFDSRVLTHDRTRGLYLHTRIGRDCFIGGRAIILPGVTVGNNCIVGAGSVVTRDVEDGATVVGNPARPIRTASAVGPNGRYLSADAEQQRLASEDAAVARVLGQSLERAPSFRARPLLKRFLAIVPWKTRSGS